MLLKIAIFSGKKNHKNHFVAIRALHVIPPKPLATSRGFTTRLKQLLST